MFRGFKRRFAGALAAVGLAFSPAAPTNNANTPVQPNGVVTTQVTHSRSFTMAPTYLAYGVANMADGIKSMTTEGYRKSNQKSMILVSNFLSKGLDVIRDGVLSMFTVIAALTKDKMVDGIAQGANVGGSVLGAQVGKGTLERAAIIKFSP